MPEELLKVSHIAKYFPASGSGILKQGQMVKAVDDVSFTVYRGETLGIVGESGCGKSTTGRLILKMIEPTAGDVLFKGQSILHLKGRQLRQIRRQMQMVFQDPFASLNPRMSVAEIIAEPLVCCTDMDAGQRAQRVNELLRLVGLDEHYANRFPHEFSGGQRQRICIARALALNPELVICDEAVSALDVSIQSQVLNLLSDLQAKLGLTYIFIAHDLSVVKHISNRIGVMYLGKLVELAEKEELFRNPLHPYTQALLSAIPIPDPLIRSDRIILEGDIPSPINPPSGCRFHTRCFSRLPAGSDGACPCTQQEPEWVEASPGHFVACHRCSALPAAQKNAG